MRGATIQGHLFQRRSIFQSTRPMRGATQVYQGTVRGGFISIHAPHAGRDPWSNESLAEDLIISIHAPHAGRDPQPPPKFPPKIAFQSTRPMRGATCPRVFIPSSVVFQSTRPMRGAT